MLLFFKKNQHNFQNWMNERRPWFNWYVFKYIASVGIGKTKWMSCLTFSDSSLGNGFAGGRRGREQQCVELSLQLFKCCRPGLSIGPLLLLIGQKCGREIGREDSAPLKASSVHPGNKWLLLLKAEEKRCPGHIVESNLCVILSKDEFKSLTAAHRHRVDALTDARYSERLRWLFKWLCFHRVPPVLPLNSTSHCYKIIAAEMFTTRHREEEVSHWWCQSVGSPPFVSYKIHQKHPRPCSNVHPANHVIRPFACHHLMLHFPPSLFLHSFPHAILDAILCDIGEFHCRDRKTCVPEAWLCDGEPDCPDESDETAICKSDIPPIVHQIENVTHSSRNTLLHTLSQVKRLPWPPV